MLLIPLNLLKFFLLSLFCICCVFANNFGDVKPHGRLKKKKLARSTHALSHEFDTDFFYNIEKVDANESPALNKFQKAFEEVEAEEKYMVDVFVKDSFTNKHHKQSCKKKYSHLKELFVDSKKHEKDELTKLKSLKQGLADIIDTFKTTKKGIEAAEQEKLAMKYQLTSLQGQLLLAQEIEQELSTLQENAKLNYETGKLEFDKHDLFSADTVKRLEKRAADPAVFSLNLEFLLDVAFLFFVSALGGMFSKALNLPPLLGYMVGGCLIGPNTLDLVHHLQDVFTISQFGSIFFLFSHGLKYKFELLKGNLNQSFIGFTFSTCGIACIFALLLQKLKISRNNFEGILCGISISLSSLTIVLQYLQKLHVLETKAGRFVLNYMTLQGLFMGFIFAIPSLLTFSEWEKYLLSASVLVLFCVFARICVKFVVKRWAYIIDYNDEVYVLGVAAFALIFSITTELCGLSLDLGAFIAGLLLAGTKLSQKTAKLIQPLASVFAGSLFASLGMLLNPQFFYNNTGLILTLVCLVVILKGLVLKSVATFISPNSKDLPYICCVSMAHVGEFSLLFTSKLNLHNLLDRRLYLLLLNATVTTLVFSSIILKFSNLLMMKKIKLKQKSSLNLQI